MSLPPADVVSLVWCCSVPANRGMPAEADIIIAHPSNSGYDLYRWLLPGWFLWYNHAYQTKIHSNQNKEV